MSEFLTLHDGTRVAFDRVGDGPAIVLIGGAFQYRAIDPWSVGFAEALASEGFTVLNYDRLGRGESVAEGELTLERELEAVAALVDHAGGRAVLWGSSSGGEIALAAAARDVPVEALVLWEVPLGEEGGDDNAAFAAEVRRLVRAGDDDATVTYFMKDMPPEWLEQAKGGPMWPAMTGVARSLQVDAEAGAWTQSAPHAELFGGIDVPVLVIVGTETLPLFPAGADAIVAAVPDGRVARIPGVGHDAGQAMDTAAVVREVVAFLRP